MHEGAVLPGGDLTPAGESRSLQANNKHTLLHFAAVFFIQSDFHPFIHAPTAESTAQGDSQLVGSSLG